MSGLYLNEAWFDSICKRVAAGEEPWASAHAAMIAEADAALDQKPLSVRDNGGSRFFRQDGVYVRGRDGVRDPDSNLRSGELAATTVKAAWTLAVAWRCTGKTEYALKALQLIHHWCVNENSAMEATGHVQGPFTPGMTEGGDILLFSRFPLLFQAAYLLKDCPQWDLYPKAAVKRWVRAMVEPNRRLMFFEGVPMYNNWEEARLLYLASGALFLDDDDLLIEVFERWRAITVVKMTDEGRLPRETMRTRSMHYTLFALDSSARVAEIAAQCGQNLYNYAVGPRRLKTAVDFASGYLLDMDAWPFEMIESMVEDPNLPRILGLFELVHARWGDARYLDIIDAYGGRPIAAGHATLLFAAG